MDLLRRIAEAQGPCITIVEHVGKAAKLQEAIGEVGGLLPADSRVEMLGSLQEHVKQMNGAEKGSVVLLRSAEVNEMLLTSEELQPMHTVTEGFLLRPILPAIQQPHEFYLLALSQSRTRLLHCSAVGCQEVPFAAGTPTSLGASRNTDKPDHMLDNRSSAGPNLGSMKGVMSGMGTELEDKPEHILTFFHEIDKAVHAMIKDTNLPLILVGVESELAIYRKANSYPLLGETGVLGSPDVYHGAEMHSRALRALGTYVPPAMQKTLHDLDKLIGTGHASVHVADIVAAAHQGRVSHLFLQGGAEYLGKFDETRGKISHHTATDEERVDLIEDAVRQSVKHGGHVTLLTGKQMPNGVPVCAVFRY